MQFGSARPKLTHPAGYSPVCHAEGRGFVFLFSVSFYALTILVFPVWVVAISTVIVVVVGGDQDDSPTYAVA
jgi:hypothetical protein